MEYKLRDYQKEASDAAVRAFKSGVHGGLLVLPTGCHVKGTNVLMYDGRMKCVEDISVGDILMGVDSTPRVVLELHHGEDEMYRITPNKGYPFVVNGGHILSLYKTREGYLDRQQPRIDEIAVTDYVNSSNYYKHLHKLYRPREIDFGKCDGYVGEPYLLGLYLGDGCSMSGAFSITTMRQEVAEYLDAFCKRCGYKLRITTKENDKAKSYFISFFGSRNNPNPILEWLKDLGLFGKKGGEKFIPHSYKTASVKDRLELLAGLLDTDAYYSNSNTYEYCTKSKVMAYDIQFLCRSLGFMCNIGKVKKVNGASYYRMQISGDLDRIPTKVGIRRGSPRRQKRNALVTGFSVECVGRGEYYGFTIDGDHLYMDEQFFVHHNSGKSLVIADIAYNLDKPLIILQPSKEILEQNFRKLMSYGITDCSVYSASFRSKEISRITFATIGSVINHLEEFRYFRYIIIDECHRVDASGGMYNRFLKDAPRSVIGLTATPYRLSTSAGGSMLKFLTRTRPRIFSKMLYCCQLSELYSNGYLADMQYFDVSDRISFDIDRVKSNSTGADYDDDSLVSEYERSGFYNDLANWTRRVLNPKDGSKRRGVLVFTKFVKEAHQLARSVPGVAVVSGSTPSNERAQIIRDFRAGKIKVVANVGTLVCGFDYPELDTIILARPTKSLALYYQIIGRALRPCKGKVGWVLDLCGTYKRFGDIADLKIECPAGTTLWRVTSKGHQLTNVLLY